jgi:membrane-associated phospholipid phosphatase
MLSLLRNWFRGARRAPAGRRPERRCCPTLEGLEDRSLPSSTTAVRHAPVPQAKTSVDEVIRWNRALIQAIRVDKTAPPLAARDMAMVQVAVYDSVNSVFRTNRPYKVLAKAAPGTSAEAAAAAAAHRVLVELFPAQRLFFDAVLRGSLARIPNPGERSGVRLGRFVAGKILDLRRNDGANAVVTYTPGTNPGDWQKTPPGFANAVLPQWPNVTPFALSSGAQLRPAGPPALTSAQYTAAFNEVKSLGRFDSTTRTPEQTAIALFWADGTGTATPPGHWNEIAQAVARSRHNSLADNARLFALLDIALADAGIVSWDAKYRYNFWRPVTAIRAADTDGNPDTTADPSWTPLLVTPPFPSYTSGHSTFSAAACEVLTRFFGSNVRFTSTSDGLPGFARTFRSFQQAADEAGMSRIYGGIHYQFDNQDGLATGGAVGRFVFANLLRRR